MVLAHATKIDWVDIEGNPTRGKQVDPRAVTWRKMLFFLAAFQYFSTREINYLLLLKSPVMLFVRPVGHAQVS